ncbi:MAG: PilZ domain-containing protein [Deltaproteobacteria bacterium]|nr:PilZ domain-containing protein [Deltaproteobacteria bacterium]
MIRQDRRISPRVPTVVAVKNYINRKLVLCQSTDISDKGMALTAPSGILLGRPRPVSIQFALPGSNTLISAQAVTVRTRDEGRFRHFAVQFTRLSNEDRALLAHFLGQTQSKSRIPSPG